MSAFACCFWWFVLGLLVGWLLNWLLSRWTRKDDSTPVVHYSATPPTAPQRMVSGGIDIAAAAMAGFQVKGPDDLPIIEGIGPKISELLKANGVPTFAKLSSMGVAEISAILDTGGPRFKLANPGTWAQQARLCNENRWSELKALQDELVAGVDMSGQTDGPKA